MSEICPLCNGLYNAGLECNKCGEQMENIGRLEDYLGPYSPYMDQESFLHNNNLKLTGDNCCIHLYKCPNCGNLEHGSDWLVSM